MVGKTLAILGVAATVGVALAPAAFAETMVQSTTTTTVTVPVVRQTLPAGPTRYWGVQNSNILPQGTNLLSANLLLGGTAATPIGATAPAVGFGIGANNANLQAQLGLAPNLEMDAGIGYISGTPWVGALGVGGKYGFMTEGVNGSFLGMAGYGAVNLTSDANGVTNVGLQVGLPISKVFPLAGNSLPLGLTAMPLLNLAYLGGNAPAGINAGAVNSLGLGVGADLGLTDSLHAIADTNLGFPSAGFSTQSAFGVRYAFSNSFTGDVFVGYNSVPSNITTATQTNLGIGGDWKF